MTLEELRKHWALREGCIRELPDGTIAAIQRLMTTWSLVLGLEEGSWEYRFCYRDFSDALADLMKVESVRDVPSGPWIACRPQVTVGEGAESRYPTPKELRELRAKGWT
jgi:hypothetical protein